MYIALRAKSGYITTTASTNYWYGIKIHIIMVLNVGYDIYCDIVGVFTIIVVIVIVKGLRL